jgi:predicted ATPase
MAALNEITIKGFKSIRELLDFKLEKLNVLVGANGAGKSNLVDFFRMLRAMADGGLQSFVINGGGADGFFFNGPKETRQISGHLKFGQNEYRFGLEPAVSGEMIIFQEHTLCTKEDSSSNWLRPQGALKESRLATRESNKSIQGGHLPAELHIYQSLSSWMVYHFHDTSNTAPMRRDCSARDYRELRSDAGNIAAFLLKMREENEVRYQRIRETLQLIAPFFDDFVLDPQMKGESELVRLEWRQQGSKFPFQPWQFSDGTIRFICLATALLQPKPPFTVVIDEPELGLHPYALEVLAQLLKESAQTTQLLVSTQSAPLLNQFEPQQVVVVERMEGASHFRRLESESLAEWLKDYALGELLQKNVIEAGPTHA